MASAPPRIALHLAHHADSAWRVVIRPWLEAGGGRLERAHVIVPTRGQAHALKQRCLTEGIALLGVEFLTPGLARKKWVGPAGGDQPVMGRELLLFGLRLLVARRLAPLAPTDAAWGFWQSLQSDPERALDDFEELLKAGFRAMHFPLPPLSEVFEELTGWAASLGYALAPLQSEQTALTVAPDETPLAGRVLVLGLGAEAWGEFFNVAAFVRRCTALTVVLPEPEFRGRKALDENWVTLWATLLGVEPQPLDAPEMADSCSDVAALWTGEGGSAARAKILVGHTRADEMALVAAELTQLLAAGADNVAVIFPRADAAHLRLARLLAARGVPFADLLETAGAPPIDLQIQRALLAFYQRGARLDELLDLWPLLHSLNFVDQPAAAAREVCARLFDEGQTHAVAAYAGQLATAERAPWREVGRIAALLLPPWPAELTLADALARFAAVSEKFHLATPVGWSALEAFAARESRPLPARVIFAAFASFLPEKSPAVGVPGRGTFARVTLTTRRRAASVAWSHLMFVESNAGVWPERRESTCWLTDDQRRELTTTGRFSLGLFTSDDRAALEKQLCASLARDTASQVIFSAALFDEEEPEIRLAPNAWLERVLFAQCRAERVECLLEEEFARRARVVAGRVAPAAGRWDEIWRRRRDPAAPFDEYFLGGPPGVTRPAWLAARQIERGARDPAELWFEAVLRVRRVEWTPLARVRKKSLGQLAHRLLAEALRGDPAEGIFLVKPPPAEARAKLAAALTRLRDHWPRDRYWDSFHSELGEMAGVLLEKVFALGGGGFLAVEASLPRGVEIAVGDAGVLAVHGRMDLVLLDRPAWAGAQVEIVDFKTGADAKLSAERMSRGASLQLGVYLAAAQSLGAAGGRVWMLKPETGVAGAVAMVELPRALTPLTQLGRHLATGCYGALTPDRTEYSHGYEWPLACTPVRYAVLAKKFAVTFAATGEGEVSTDE